MELFLETDLVKHGNSFEGIPGNLFFIPVGDSPNHKININSIVRESKKGRKVASTISLCDVDEHFVRVENTLTEHQKYLLVGVERIVCSSEPRSTRRRSNSHPNTNSATHTRDSKLVCVDTHRGRC